MSIKDNLKALKQSIPTDKVTIVAVSKTHPAEKIQELYNEGQRDFGENKVQELIPKYEALPKDIRWHMIGHLQSNKVKYIAPFVQLIHSVDSVKLLKEINKQARKNERVIDCLLQVHIALEESKYGFSEDELNELLINNPELDEMKNIRLRGLMGMATNTDDPDRVSKEFRSLNELYNSIKNGVLKDVLPYFNILSMGMTQDYDLAIAEGSNMIRVGSLIFGERDYSTSTE